MNIVEFTEIVTVQGSSPDLIRRWIKKKQASCARAFFALVDARQKSSNRGSRKLTWKLN